jgi:hypothetical protein
VTVGSGPFPHGRGPFPISPWTCTNTTPRLGWLFPESCEPTAAPPAEAHVASMRAGSDGLVGRLPMARAFPPVGSGRRRSL